MSYKRVRFGKEEQINAKLHADNPHLKAIILLALDAGMRRGEILKLRWADVDFAAGEVRIVGTHTKTERSRNVPLTERVASELNRIREFSAGDRIFPFNEFKTSWATAKRIAGIEDLRFHDLRRTAITRWQKWNVPLALAGKLAGHTNLQTTMKHYTSTDAEMIKQLRETMNTQHARVSVDAEVAGLAN